MITRSDGSSQPPPWQREMARAIRDPAELLELLGLDAAFLPAARRAAERFPLLVPRSFVERMGHADPEDPLLRQILPLDAELASQRGFVADPVGDLPAAAAPGVLRKYRGRTLLIATGACAVNCRYCFRREYPYADNHASKDGWRDALETIADDDDCVEVILSGGDPLMLADRRLEALSDALRALPRIRRLRIHTRVPVVLPSRVDDGLIEWLGGLHCQAVMVLHTNHPNEIDSAVRDAAGRLRTAGVTLLNQSVLLRGVNDSAETLCALSETLFASGVLPYYLHLLDPVRGAGHFDVPAADAVALVREAAARLSGYLVPRLVRETPGAPSKLPVVTEIGSETWEAEGLAMPL